VRRNARRNQLRLVRKRNNVERYSLKFSQFQKRNFENFTKQFSANNISDIVLNLLLSKFQRSVLPLSALVKQYSLFTRESISQPSRTRSSRFSLTLAVVKEKEISRKEVKEKEHRETDGQFVVFVCRKRAWKVKLCTRSITNLRYL